jgi:AhpD family alkylhydroperoxidase
MISMQEVEWEPPLLAPKHDAAIEARAKQLAGYVPGGTAYFAGVPWLAEALTLMHVANMTRVHIDHDLADLVGLVVSQDNSCRYCFAAQRTLLRFVGHPEERIRQLERDVRTADLPPAKRVALEFARRLSRANPLVTPADTAVLREAGYGDDEIREISAQAGLLIFFNRISTLAALPPEPMERLPDRWWARLLRPVGALKIAGMRHRSTGERLREDQRTGPFVFVTNALDGLPTAPALRQSIDGLFASPVLGRRAKILVFVLVARALGCICSEREATALLADDGLPPEETERVLSHLASPALDPVEAVVVPFARETVWYEAAPLQRRAREVQHRLTNEQFLELIAAAAIANTVCRLGFLVAAAA